MGLTEATKVDLLLTLWPHEHTNNLAFKLGTYLLKGTNRNIR